MFEKAKNDDWHVLLTPTKPVPKDWFCEIKNAEILGLACGGGQQMPIFAALGAKCTVLDYSEMKDEQLYRESIKNNWGIQFSHTIEEQIGGQLRAGFILTDIYQDTNGFGRLHEFNVPTYYATRAIKI
ncbi:MAG TPA: hypothetical protein DEF39_02060 [Hungateiclostridium thermocellum]|uniref:Uncharacterized protein n=2 Tax=Acetivibrio thermocellus TaxID=1515 RepID=A3DC89_ACET2|nr:hypothetical protein [Acetivibrio thermocellus]ANV76655.1 hypothetical protein LQRI_1914 [Acetivibrio thermocellus DSM 2360]CDG35008.1 hypothetical protein CTHBC1_0339 [Acetivibrio thermocellus BC1]ABN51568.1 hypothetical protein Cthe_0330 [Acetivibrio thermocellus ATCC 27405]ALX08905.1 hypothetical protein AD2_01915 [Acetivibrio thermocellus AD2]EIC05137.1 hypothetical protein YSBL_1214 [Acetivibrio thermocellus YS]